MPRLKLRLKPKAWDNYATQHIKKHKIIRKSCNSFRSFAPPPHSSVFSFRNVPPSVSLSLFADCIEHRNLTKLNFESWSEAGNPAERPPKINVGEERSLLGKIAEGGRFRTVKFLLNPFPLQSGGKFRPKSRKRERSIQ